MRSSLQAQCELYIYLRSRSVILSSVAWAFFGLFEVFWGAGGSSEMTNVLSTCFSVGRTWNLQGLGQAPWTPTQHSMY